MKTIHKFRINPGKDATCLTLKRGFRVVRCEYLVPEKGVYLWVEQSLKVTTPTVEREFRLVFSGEPVPEHYRYLGTALDTFGPEAYHVFEVTSDATELLPEEVSREAVNPGLFSGATFHPVSVS